MNPAIVETGDGSHTLFVEELNEHFHSVHGAFSESGHVFIECGLRFVRKDAINLLEIGFGTGLNCLLTALDAKKTGKNINYLSVDKFPLKTNLLQKLNYGTLIDGASALFDSIIEAPWEKITRIETGFTLGKFCFDAIADTFPFNTIFDLVYYDAFAPSKQPEMWNIGIFSKIAAVTAPAGVFVTYCSKGDVRRALQQSGFEMERLPGPKGKREILRGIKKIQEA